MRTGDREPDLTQAQVQARDASIKQQMLAIVDRHQRQAQIAYGTPCTVSYAHDGGVLDFSIAAASSAAFSPEPLHSLASTAATPASAPDLGATDIARRDDIPGTSLTECL